MIDVTVLDYLSAALDCPVVMELPEEPPERLVLLRRGDTTREDWVETTMFILESYGSSLLEAAQLNERAKAAMDALPELPEIAASRLATDYPAPDTTTKRHRYQAVYNVTHY